MTTSRSSSGKSKCSPPSPRDPPRQARALPECHRPPPPPRRQRHRRRRARTRRSQRTRRQRGADPADRRPVGRRRHHPTAHLHRHDHAPRAAADRARRHDAHHAPPHARTPRRAEHQLPHRHAARQRDARGGAIEVLYHDGLHVVECARSALAAVTGDTLVTRREEVLESVSMQNLLGLARERMRVEKPPSPWANSTPSTRCSPPAPPAASSRLRRSTAAWSATAPSDHTPAPSSRRSPRASPGRSRR